MKQIMILVLILISGCLLAENLTFKFDGSTALYYTEYKDYDWDKPLTALYLNAEVYNLSGNFGFGATGFYSIFSSDYHFDAVQFYDGYLHYFTALEDDDHYFIYGFYGGFRIAKIDYTIRGSGNEKELIFTHPLVGFKFSNELWGFDLTWSQAENRKPILGYEVKFSNNSGWIIKVGRRNRGFISDVNSDFFLNLGYEFYG